MRSKVMCNSQTILISILMFPLRLKLCRLLLECNLTPATGPRGSRTAASEGEDRVGQPAIVSVQS